MPIPNREQWRQVLAAAQRTPPPGEGLVKQRAPRVTAYQGFVRVIGHPLAYGWQLGLVTEYDEALDQFVDRGDVPVWVRTPRRQPLEVWRSGCPDGRGVFWGRAQGSAQVSTVVGTGTASVTGASGTGSGDTQTLPVYIVDDCCPTDTGPCEEPPVQTGCCGEPIPATLYVEVTSSANMGDLVGTHEATYNPGSGRWETEPLPIGASVVRISGECRQIVSVWYWVTRFDCLSGSGTPYESAEDSISCNPFSIPEGAVTPEVTCDVFPFMIGTVQWRTTP